MIAVKKIGILGGTFNPIHNGHLIMAEAIREDFRLDKVLFIPSGNPPHKSKNEVIDKEHRYNMVCEAINENDFFEKSRIEIEREGYTYTIDTLKRLKASQKEDVLLYYIIGADVLYDLNKWKDYQSVFKTCEFIAALRPGSRKEEFRDRIKYLNNNFEAKIYSVNIPLIDISSTEIRKRVKEGKSIKYLVPENVENYIKNNKLYLT
ncbi:nicotinate-nucleotide adenylyltransferase [Herbivorax alkaliphila]